MKLRQWLSNNVQLTNSWNLETSLGFLGIFYHVKMWKFREKGEKKFNEIDNKIFRGQRRR